MGEKQMKKKVVENTVSVRSKTGTALQPLVQCISDADILHELVNADPRRHTSMNVFSKQPQ